MSYMSFWNDVHMCEHAVSFMKLIKTADWFKFLECNSKNQNKISLIKNLKRNFFAALPDIPIAYNNLTR